MTTDKARAEAEAIMWRHALQPEHGRRFIPDPEAMTAAIAAALTARDAEAEKILGDIEEALGADRRSDHTMLPGIVKDLREAAAEAAAKLARVEANVARWQHEAEGLREAVRVLVCAAVEMREAILCASADLGDGWVDRPMIDKARRMFDDAMLRTSKVLEDRGGVFAMLDESVSDGGKFNMRGYAKAALDAAGGA